MRLWVAWDADAEERKVLAEAPLPVVYAADGARFRPGDGVLTFWPKRELARSGMAWSDVADAAWVKVCTAGVNHIGWRDVPPGLPIHSTPGATGPIIAEYVLGATIAWARGFQRHTQAIRQGDFDLGAPVRSLAELRIGLVGYGGIGQAVAAVLGQAGATVAAVSRSGKSPASDRLDWLGTMEDLPRLAQDSDVLVVAVPLTRGTEGLIGRATLEALGHDSLLINVARGNVVVEGDLYDWLQSTPSSHAHLDVWWAYPKEGGRPFTRPFHQLDNVTMTPHNSPNVQGHRATMVQRALQDIEQALETGVWAHRESAEEYGMKESGDTR